MISMHQVGRWLAALAITVIIGFNLPAGAGAARDAGALRVIRHGDIVEIDPAGIPPAQRDGYAILRKHCVDCHGQDRIIEALQSGKSRSGNVYGEEEFHHKVTQILRRPGVGMDRDDARKLDELLIFLVRKIHPR
jgi:mono/diheme cytochrome c family protein